MDENITGWNFEFLTDRSFLIHRRAFQFTFGGRLYTVFLFLLYSNLNVKTTRPELFIYLGISRCFFF